MGTLSLIHDLVNTSSRDGGGGGIAAASGVRSDANFTPTDACALMRVFPDALRPGKQSGINLSQFKANLSAA
jgi:hypothetical protein